MHRNPPPRQRGGATLKREPKGEKLTAPNFNSPQFSQPDVYQSSPVSGFRVKFDWITFMVSGVRDLDKFLEFFLMPDYSWERSELNQKFAGRRYIGKITAPGLFFRYGIDQESYLYYIHAELSGKYLSRFDLLGQLGIFRYLKANKVHSTRYDVALDDYRRMVSDEQIIKACKVGNCSGFRKYQRKTSAFIKNDEYQTIYLGASKKMVRRYDALPVHGEDCHRWELQLREHHARKFIDVFYKNEEIWDSFSIEDSVQAFSKFLLDYLLGSVSFIKKSDKNLDRCPLLSWWQRFINKLEAQPTWITLPKVEKSIQKTIDWHYRQVSSSLAIFAGALDFDRFLSYVDSLIEYGKEKFADSHRSLMRNLAYHADSYF